MNFIYFPLAFLCDVGLLKFKFYVLFFHHVHVESYPCVIFILYHTNLFLFHIVLIFLFLVPQKFFHVFIDLFTFQTTL
jgi:hypothetical protein